VEGGGIVLQAYGTWPRVPSGARDSAKTDNNFKPRTLPGFYPIWPGSRKRRELLNESMTSHRHMAGSPVRQSSRRQRSAQKQWVSSILGLSFSPFAQSRSAAFSFIRLQHKRFDSRRVSTKNQTVCLIFFLSQRITSVLRFFCLCDCFV
jgi:hypothetical protein